MRPEAETQEPGSALDENVVNVTPDPIGDRDLPEETRFTRAELLFMATAVRFADLSAPEFIGLIPPECRTPAGKARLSQRIASLASVTGRIGATAAIMLPDTQKVRNFIFSQWTEEKTDDGNADQS